MKKIFTLCLAFMSIGAISAQNLLVNPSVETWEAGKASSWDFFSGTGAAAALVVYTQETSIVNDGTSAVKITNPTTGNTANVSQSYGLGSLTVGDTYELSFDYYVVSGDDTDVRMWSGWKSSNGTAYPDIDHDYAALRHGGGSTTVYLPSNVGTWSSYTATTTVPANAAILDFRVRSYKGSVVIFDNFSLVNKSASGIGSNSADRGFNAYTVAGLVKVELTDTDAQFIELYNVLGKQIAKVKAVSGVNEIAVQAGQILIVKVGTKATKVVTK